MGYDDLVGHFGTPSEAGRALGVDRRQVNDWKKRRIPTKHQLKAQQESNGKLVPDAEALKEAAELKAILLQPQPKAA
jgi:hypothetical protein